MSDSTNYIARWERESGKLDLTWFLDDKELRNKLVFSSFFAQNSLFFSISVQFRTRHWTGGFSALSLKNGPGGVSLEIEKTLD